MGLCGRWGVGPNTACQIVDTTRLTFVRRHHGYRWYDARATQSWGVETCSTNSDRDADSTDDHSVLGFALRCEVGLRGIQGPGRWCTRFRQAMKLVRA